MSSTQSAAMLSLVGGSAALDFANTASGRGTAFFVEHLTDVQALLAWAVHAGLLDEPAIEAKEGDLPAALGLREAIYEVSSAIANGRPVPAEDIDRIRDCAIANMGAIRLSRSKDGQFEWVKPPESAAKPALLAHLALDAIDILRNAELKRLKQCPGKDCGWMFLDTTRNGSRRWCDMAVCGNRTKARRHRGRMICE